MNKQPEQTAKTRRSMIDAFWELAAQNGIDKVTISAVTKSAGLNRSTFYVYFADMPDLLAQAEDEIIANLKEKLKANILGGGIAGFEDMSAGMIELFTMYDEKFFMLIGKNGDPNFRAVVQSEAAKMFAEVFSHLDSTENSGYITAYLTSAFMGILTYWHETGKKISVRELAEIVHSLATKGVMGLIAPPINS